MMQTKSILLLGGLLISLWLTWQSYQKEQGLAVSLPTRTLANSHAQVATHKENKTFHLAPRVFVESTENLFASGYVAPPVIKQPARKVHIEVPKPIAPPLPFKYVGQWKDNEKELVMLSVNDEVIPAKQGDVLLTHYLVKTIASSPQGMQIEFLYQPLNQVQQLYVGKAQNE